MTALAETADRAELRRLAHYSMTFPNAAFSPVLALSVLPRIETAEVFDRLRAALRRGDETAARRALDELVGSIR